MATVRIGYQRIRVHAIHRSGGASPDRKSRRKMVTKHDPIAWHRISVDRLIELDQIPGEHVKYRRFVEK